MTAADQARFLGEAWDRTPHDSALGTRLVVYSPDGNAQRFTLGAHAPDLAPEDIERIHRLWLEAVKAVGPEVHHRNVVSAALAGMEKEMGGARRNDAIERLLQQIRQVRDAPQPDHS